MQISNSFSEPVKSHHELFQLSQKSAKLLKGVLLGLFLDAGCVSQGMLLPAPMLVLAALQADEYWLAQVPALLQRGLEAK